MKRNFFKTILATITALSCILTCGIIGNAKMTARAETTTYTQTFTSLTQVKEDFKAYYQTAMGASSMMMDIGDSEDDSCNWYVKDGVLQRCEVDNDVDQSFDTSRIAMLTLTKRTYVNFELTVEYKRSADTYYWPVVAFRQSEPGRYFLEDGVGAFVQRNGQATMWGGEGVGGPYESSSRGGYTDTAWHKLRLRVEGLSVKIFIDNDTAPALSRNLPAAMFRHGYITLTSVNNLCAFRNLTIQELPITALDQEQAQTPQPEANTSDALGNLADKVGDIDELDGLTQDANSSSTTQTPAPAPEQSSGCGSALTAVNGLWVLVASALIYAKKRQKL